MERNVLLNSTTSMSIKHDTFNAKANKLLLMGRFVGFEGACAEQAQEMMCYCYYYQWNRAEFVNIDKIRVSFYCMLNWFERHVLSWRMRSSPYMDSLESSWRICLKGFLTMPNWTKNPFDDIIHRIWVTLTHSIMFILCIDRYNMLTYAGERHFHFIGFILLLLLAYIFVEYSLHFMAYLHLLIFRSWKVITSSL